MKYEIGEIVSLTYNGAYDGWEGEVVEIDEDRPDPYHVRLIGAGYEWFAEGELERIEEVG